MVILCPRRGSLRTPINLGHANILTYCNRPFKNVDDMNQQIIERWNSKVGLWDDVYRPVKRSNKEVLIHGHTHSKEKGSGNQIHVGVDAWDYYPVSEDEIKSLIG